MKKTTFARLTAVVAGTAVMCGLLLEAGASARRSWEQDTDRGQTVSSSSTAASASSSVAEFSRLEGADVPTYNQSASSRATSSTAQSSAASSRTESSTAQSSAASSRAESSTAQSSAASSRAESSTARSSAEPSRLEGAEVPAYNQQSASSQGSSSAAGSSAASSRAESDDAEVSSAESQEDESSEVSQEDEAEDGDEEESRDLGEGEPHLVVIETTGEDQQLEVMSYPEGALQLLELVNQQRKAAGLSALAEDDELTELALIRGAELSLKFSTTRMDESPWYKGSEGDLLLGGEDFLRDAEDPQQVLERWADSPLKNLTQPGFGKTGAACVLVDGNYYWVQVYQYE